MRYIVFIAGMLLSIPASAQELFINTEPASNMPKYSYGFRLGSESFALGNSIHNRIDIEAMYEFTSDFMAHAMIHASNYYGNYGYNNFELYGKYRLYTEDGFKSHFRIAAYAEAAFGASRNSYAEIMLDGGNSGINAGLIFTLLQNRFALSSTLGVTAPLLATISSSIYSNVRNYLFSLSAGYLIFPSAYESYHDLNFNLYTELLGKYVTHDILGLEGPEHNHGIILDLAIGPQIIINSISRVDLSVRTRLIHGVESFPKPSVLVRYEQMLYH